MLHGIADAADGLCNWSFPEGASTLNGKGQETGTGRTPRGSTGVPFRSGQVG